MSTVLLIKDDVEARELLSDLLSRYGVTVVSVATCVDGMPALEGGMAPDVILSDVKLPDGLGTVVLAYILTRPTLHHTPRRAGHRLAGDRAARHQTVNQARKLPSCWRSSADLHVTLDSGALGGVPVVLS